MKITTLASSSSGNAYTVEVDNSTILIECGMIWSKLLKLLDYNLPNMCLISHEHYDHAKSAKDISMIGVPIVCSDGTAKALGILESQRIAPGNIRLLKAVHDAAEPSAFVVDSESGDRLLFATDTSEMNFTVKGVTHLMIETNWSYKTVDYTCPQFEKAVNTHLSLEKAIEFVKELNKSRLKEVHIMHLSSRNSDREYFLSEMRKACGVPVYGYVGRK